MINLMLCSAAPVECCGRSPYSGMAYDGTHFYLCGDGSSMINQIDPEGKTVRQICTRNPYRSLCYDSKKKIFWALSYIGKSIYKLTSSFQEIDCIQAGMTDCSPIYDLTYSHCCDRIVLCGPDALFRTSGGMRQEKIASACSGEHFKAAAEFHGCMTVASGFAKAPNILRVSECGDPLHSITCLPDGHCAQSMCAGYEEEHRSYLYVLTTKKSAYSNILKYQYLRMEKRHAGDTKESLSPSGDMACIQTVQIN